MSTRDRRDIAALLVDIVGSDAALALMRHPAIGGRCLVFSRGKRADGMDSYRSVAAVVGDDKARALAEAFDGEPVSIPNCAKQLTAQKHAAWRKRYDELLAARGTARSAIAALKEEAARNGQNVTERWLWEVTGRAEPALDERQGGLF